MSQIHIESKLMRLLFEILIVVGLSETAVMFLLPVIAPNISEAGGAALDAGMLTFLSGPILLWRFARIGRARTEPSPGWRGDPRRGIHSLVWTIITFGIGMALTGGAAIWAYQKEHAEGQERFEHHVEKLQTDLLARFSQPLDGLNAMAGLYSAGTQVNRRTFSRFWSAMDIAGVFPGVRSFGVIEPVPRDELERYVRRIRAEDGNDFSVQHPSAEATLYIVRHLASSLENRPVIGMDMATEPERKRAIDAALQQGVPILSDTIELVPLNGVRNRGLLYFRPIYPHGTGQNARPNVAYATIVLEDIVAGVLPMTVGISDFELLDTATPGESTVLFDSRKQGDAARDTDTTPRQAPRFSVTSNLVVNGHPMQLRVYSAPAYETSHNAIRPARIGTALMLLTLFMSLAIWLLTRRRDQALEESYRIASENQRLAKAVQRSSNSVIIGNERNEIVWANEAFSRISGFSLEEALGRKPSELRNTAVTDPASLERIRSALSRCEDVRTQSHSQAADGSDYWLDMDVQVLRTEDGDYAGFVAVETDITEERRVAQKLRSALQEARGLMATLDTHAIVAETDSRGTITKVNEGFVRISGYQREELLGSNHRLVNSGVHPPEFWRDMWNTISAGHPWHGEVCIRSKSGELHWLDSMIAPFTGDDGTIEKYVSIRIDMTEQKRAQDKLLTSTNLLEASQRIARVGGWELDLKTELLFWTAETFRILETTPEELLPSMDTLAQYLEPASRQSMTAALALATAHGEGFDLELQAHTVKGNPIDLRMTCVLTATQGSARTLTGILQDITQTKQYQKSLEEARIKAELATQTKGQFLANMSHEIRTPMNAIRGMATLLQKTQLSSQQFDYASKIDGASRSLLGLINDILDFSKAEVGKMTLDIQPFRLDKLMRDLAVILSSNVGTKAIDIIFDIDSDLPDVLLGDSMRLQQILINLGGNAVKFTSSGQVVVSVHKQQDDPLRIEFSVEDSGIGIAPEYLEHIFDGFSQAEASTTRKFGGTGLGLSISKRLVELMHGELRVQSTPGQGSTFSFAIEMPSASPDADMPPDTEPRAPGKTVRHVLVIDDNHIASDIMSRMTRSWDWPTEVAASGAEALALLRGHGAERPFDTVYVDWQMPGMDGWQTARSIRDWYTSESLPQPVIVMVSGNGRDTLEQRTQEEQKLLDGFLVKPVTASMLQEATLALSTSEFRLRKRSRSSARQLEGMRILVVEDNLLNQQVAEELLHSEGAHVALAANGRLGVNAVASADPQFDAVLMDIQMPVMDGFAATRTIREKLQLRDLPIIAMTANAMTTDREECLAAGMNEHVGKPFDLAELVQTLLLHTGFAPRPPSPVRPPVASDLPEVPGLELQAALSRMSGLKSLYVRSAQDFLQTLQGCADEYRTLCATGPEHARRQMHTLKSTAALLGANALSTTAARIETHCKHAGAALQAEPEASELDLVIASTRPLLLQAIALLSPSVEVPVAAAETRSEHSDTASKLNALAALLEAEDLQALETFADIRASLVPLPAEPLQGLEQALQELDLKGALPHCRQLIAAL